MAIRDLMTTDVEVIAPDAKLVDAASRMAEEDIGFLPVCDGDRIVGTITDRDITVRATADGRDPKLTQVAEIMTKDVAWCYDDEEIERVSRLMKERQIRRAIVVNRDKRLVGVVALGDLARQQQGQSTDVLQSVSEAPPTH